MPDTIPEIKLSPQQYLQALKRDGEAMHQLLASQLASGTDDLTGILDAAVPSCSAWNVEKLIRHLGRVFCSVREHVARRSLQMIPADEIEPAPKGEAVVAWFAQTHARVLEALTEVDPQEPIWSWAGERHGNGAFYQRRLAHEVLIHRWDLENALGAAGELPGELPTELPAELALDNVDELLQVVLPFTIANWDRDVPTGSIHLHATDLPAGEWLVTPMAAPGGTDSEAPNGTDSEAPNGTAPYVVSYEHAKGDVAVRGTAETLALFVWERVGLEELQSSGKAEVFGDFELAKQWAQVSR